MAKSLHEVKIDERKQSKPNMLTDSDYFLRDKEKEKLLGYPNTIDITGMTTSSQEEANDVKVKALQKQLEDMTKMLDTLKQDTSDEAEKTNTRKGNSNKNKKDETVNDDIITVTGRTDSSIGINEGDKQ